MHFKAFLFLSCLELVEKQAIPTEIFGGLVKEDDNTCGDIERRMMISQ